MSETHSTCAGCGLLLAHHAGPTHPYLGSSAACWSLFGELGVREGRRRGARRLSTDAYAVQHPGRRERRSVRSVALHLMTMALILERGVRPADATALLGRFARRAPADLRWLEPPRPNGTVTVQGVLGADDLRELDRRVWAWARDVWSAWEPHHDTVRAWLDHGVR